MTNLEIIAGEMMLRGITEDCHTYQGWKWRGKQVSKGQKALFTTSIWKPVKGKKSEEVEDGAEDKGKMILVKAAFFGASQVEDAQPS